jgi:methylmalonyl-CoA/ethylmalonyl-CoA epimerase
MAKVNRINHVAIVVQSIEASLPIWRSLGLETGGVIEVPEHESRVAFFQIGDSEIELVEPTNDSSGIARYLNKHGEGLHHICIEVEDLDSLLRGLRADGFRLVNQEPLTGKDGRKYAFIHPESTNGVLVELYGMLDE